MKMLLFVIYDRLAEMSGPIFMSVNMSTALRSYTDGFEPGGQMARYKLEDFSLMYLGTYDRTSIKIDLLDVPEVVTAERVGDLQQSLLLGGDK